MRKKIKMKGLTCSSCIRKITDKLLESEFIEAANYNLINEVMVIDYNGEVSIIKETKRIKKIVNSFEDGIKVYFEGEAVEQESSFINTYWILFVGLIVFMVGIYLNNDWVVLAGYIFFVSKIARKAIKSMFTKISFDENMLMFIATIAAMYIGEKLEAIVVIIFYTIGEYLQNRAVGKSKEEIKSLIDLKVESGNCYKGGILMQVAPEEIEVGDRILVKVGERVPVDCKVVHGSTSIDMSSLTGESKPVDVTSGDELISGSINLQSPIEAVASKEYTDSMIAKVVEMIENSSMNKADTEEFITKFAKWYTPVVAILALLIFLVPTLIDYSNHMDYLRRAAILLVISCPCALVLSIPLTYFAGIGKSASMGVLFKGSNYLDTMSKISDVYLDKTGTITHGNFVVSDYTDLNTLLLAASVEKYSNHPIANAILEANKEELVELNDIEEIAGCGIKSSYEGKIVLVGNARLMKEYNVDFEKQDASETVVFVSYNGLYMGRILISDQIKESSKGAIERLLSEGINVTMLTGDNDKIASKVAKEVCDISYKANLLPQNKSEYVTNLKSEGNTLFVGDGINDSIALVNADVGITMGQRGSDLALEVSDVVILNDDLSLLSKTINIAKKTKKIVIQNIVGTLFIKVIFLTLGVLGVSTMWMAIIADVGVSLIAVLNSLRILSHKVD